MLLRTTPMAGLKLLSPVRLAACVAGAACPAAVADFAFIAASWASSDAMRFS